MVVGEEVRGVIAKEQRIPSYDYENVLQLMVMKVT